VVKKAEIVFILDETGSMFLLAEDTCGSFWTFIEEQKKLDAEVGFTLVLFSNTGLEENYRPMYQGASLDDVVPLVNGETYRPRGMTPLYDAIGSTIDSVGTRLAGMKEEDRPDFVILAVLTDGMENASVEYSREKVKGMIAHQRDKYSWQILFLGAGIDAEKSGAAIGIMRDATFSYAGTGGGVKNAYQTMSRSISHTVSGDSDKNHE